MNFKLRFNYPSHMEVILMIDVIVDDGYKKMRVMKVSLSAFVAI